MEDYLDIKSDIETECSRFGQVLSVVIPRGEDPGVGNGIVEYPSIQQAAGAVVALIGRRFNKHIIRAAFMSETAYANKQYNVYTDLLPNTTTATQSYISSSTNVKRNLASSVENQTHHSSSYEDRSLRGNARDQ